MAGFYFIPHVFSFESVFFSLFLLTLSSSVFQEPKPLSPHLDSRILHELIRIEKEDGRSLYHGNSNSLAEAVMSSVRYQRDSVTESEPLYTEERGVEPGRIWLHQLLNYISQQNKFKDKMEYKESV